MHNIYIYIYIYIYSGKRSAPRGGQAAHTLGRRGRGARGERTVPETERMVWWAWARDATDRQALPKEGRNEAHKHAPGLGIYTSAARR